MSLSRPTIVTPIAAFDATVGTTIYYNISGGELPTKNKFQIFNEDYTIVWDSEFVDGYNNYVVIPPDTTHLVNGTKYYILVQTGLGNEVSPVSYMVAFYCYTTPVFEFTDVPSIVPSSTYIFSAEYSQAQNELLNTYIFTLYNTSNIPIATSGALYASSLTPTQGVYSLSYNFDGMLDGQTFKIGLTGETLQHTKLEITPVEFQVQYDEKEAVGAITLKSVCKEGKVVVTSSIDANNGIPHRDVTYIDNKEADLSSNSVLWDNVETEQDFTIRTVFRAVNVKPHQDKTIMTLQSDTGQTIGTIGYRYNAFIEDAQYRVDCFLVIPDSQKIFSNSLYGIPNDLTKFVLQVRHKNNAWTLRLGILEQPTPSLYMDRNSDVHEVWFDEVTPYIEYTIDSTETEDNLTATYNDDNIKPEFNYSENNGDVKITI